MRSVCVVLIALLLLVACTAESGLRANKNEEEELIVVDADFDDEDPSSQRRELFGWLSFVFSVCPPGPLGHHCRGGDSSGSSGGSSGGSSSGGSSSSSSGSASSYVNNESSGESAATDVYEPTTSNERGFGGASRSFSWALIGVAIAAAAAAVIAAAIGSRKKKRVPHQLEGSVARRIALFSNFADSSLCGSTERPERVVEMTASHDDYRLA